MSLGPAHPHICHQGQLYCAAQVRYRRALHPKCCSWCRQKGREGHLSLAHARSLVLTLLGLAQLCPLPPHQGSALLCCLQARGPLAQPVPQAAGQTRDICTVFGGNMGLEQQHSPWLSLDYGPRHGCQQQHASICPHGLRWQLRPLRSAWIPTVPPR